MKHLKPILKMGAHKMTALNFRKQYLLSSVFLKNEKITIVIN